MAMLYILGTRQTDGHVIYTGNKTNRWPCYIYWEQDKQMAMLYIYWEQDKQMAMLYILGTRQTDGHVIYTGN